LEDRLEFKLIWTSCRNRVRKKRENLIKIWKVVNLGSNSQAKAQDGEKLVREQFFRKGEKHYNG